MQTSIRTINVTKSSVNVFLGLIDMKYPSVDIFQNFLENCRHTTRDFKNEIKNKIQYLYTKAVSQNN